LLKPVIHLNLTLSGYFSLTFLALCIHQPSPLLSCISLSFSKTLPFQISAYKVLSVMSFSSLHFNSSGETPAFFDNHSYSNDSILTTSLTLISSEKSCPTLFNCLLTSFLIQFSFTPKVFPSLL